MPPEIRVIGVEGMPEVQPGDDAVYGRAKCGQVQGLPGGLQVVPGLIESDFGLPDFGFGLAQFRRRGTPSDKVEALPCHLQV